MKVEKIVFFLSNAPRKPWIHGMGLVAFDCAYIKYGVRVWRERGSEFRFGPFWQPLTLVSDPLILTAKTNRILMHFEKLIFSPKIEVFSWKMQPPRAQKRNHFLFDLGCGVGG